MDVFESILIPGLSWWQINSGLTWRGPFACCEHLIQYLPVNGDVMRGEGASTLVPAGRSKLPHYLPSIRPSRFATLGLPNLSACARTRTCLYLSSPRWVHHTGKLRSVSTKDSLTDLSDILDRLFLSFFPSLCVCISVCFGLREAEDCDSLKGVMDKYTPAVTRHSTADRLNLKW